MADVPESVLCLFVQSSMRLDIGPNLLCLGFSEKVIVQKYLQGVFIFNLFANTEY